MSKIEWSKDYSMGSRVIDVHHQQLIDYINQLEEAVEAGNCEPAFLDSIADKLLDYTDYHFSSEEAYMRKYNYPELQAHIEEHQAFIQEVKRIKELAKSESSGIDLEILAYLKKWLMQHILIIDKEYSIYFQKQGVQLP